MKGPRLSFALALALGFYLFIVSAFAASPAPPTNLRSSWVDTVSAVLTWDDSEEADAFNVYRWDSSAQRWLLAGSHLLEPIFREIPPSVEMSYTYAVSTLNGTVESEAAVSTVQSGGWPDTTINPYIPDYYNGLAGRTNATLQFAADIVSGVDAVLEIGLTPDALQYAGYQPQYDTWHSFQVTNLTPATLYFYRFTYSQTNHLGMTFASSFYTLPPNAPPEVYPVQVEMDEDQTFLNIWPNGWDLDSYAPWPVRFVVPPAFGNARVDDSGSFFIYTPATNFFGIDSFEYVMNDGEDDSIPATVTITVHPVNDIGLVLTDTLTLSAPQDTPIAGTVSIFDVDNDAYSLAVATPPESGTVQMSGTNFIYMPAPGFHGVIHFVLTAADSQGVSALGQTQVTLTLTAVDEPPVAVQQSVVTSEDTSVAFVLQAQDPDGGPVAWSIVLGPAHGALSGTAPNLTYVPEPNFFGADSFRFAVSNGQAPASVATITFEVNAVNDAPVGQNSIAHTDEDTAILCPIFATDLEGDTLAFEVVRSPAHGTLLDFTASPRAVRYLPEANFFGVDSFDLRANDGAATGNTFTITLNISPIDDAPVAVGQSLTVIEDQPLPLTLTATDLDGGPIAWQIVTGPTHGNLAGTPPNLTYTPAPNYFGPDSVTFSADNGQAAASQAVLSIQVAPVDDPPVGQNTLVNTGEDTPVVCPLVASDVEGDSLTFQVVRLPSHGTLGPITGNVVSYTPDANFFGADSFDVRPSDGSASGNIFTVTIQVAPVDDAPVALPQSLSTAEDQALPLTLTASDVDGGPLSWQIISLPAHGTLSGNVPNLIYTPAPNYNGPDSFRFSAAPGSEAAVNIQVTPVNDAPIASSLNLTTAYNTPVAVAVSATDVDSPALTYSILSTPANGTLTGTAPNLTFTPAIGWSGITSFTFRASDGLVTSSPATVTITVQGTTSAPAAPSGLTAQAVSNSQINLAWIDNSANEDGFAIERSTGTTFAEIARVGPNTRNFASAGLTANKSYSYRVRAYNVRGNSAYSNTASAKTSR